MTWPTRVLLDRLALIAAAVILVFVILLAFAGNSSVDQWLVSLLVLMVGYALVRGSLLLQGPVLRLLGLLGAIAAGGCTLVVLASSWRVLGKTNADSFRQWVLPSMSLAAFAAFTAYVGLLHRRPVRGIAARVARGLAVACMGFTMGLAGLGFLSDRGVMWSVGTGMRWWPPLALACMVTHVAAVLIARADERREQNRLAALHDRALATLQCVRCGQWMQMHSGKAACPRCRSVIRLEFEEPRCACGYPLHRLPSPQCPECGTEIPPEKRWLGGAPPPGPLTQATT